MTHLSRFSEDLFTGLTGRVAIIGNATPAWELGALIDQYDAVIRMNNYRTEGYEKLVGRKTTHRCTTGWKDVEPRGEFPEFSPFTAQANESSNVADFNAISPRPLLTARTDVHPFIPEVKRPSTGLALVQLCVQAGLRVDLFAFDGFKTAHYWEQEKGVYTTHSLSELDFILRRPGVLLYNETRPPEQIPLFPRASDPVRHDAAARRLTEHLKNQPAGRRILLFGAGDGELARVLEEQGHEVTVMTPSRAVFEALLCSRKIHGPALALALVKESFDVFVAVHSLDGLTDNDCRLALREGVRLCASAFVAVSESEETRTAKWWSELLRASGFAAAIAETGEARQRVFIGERHATAAAADEAPTDLRAELARVQEELRRERDERIALEERIADLNEQWQSLLDAAQREAHDQVQAAEAPAPKPKPASEAALLDEAEAKARAALALNPEGRDALKLLAVLCVRRERWTEGAQFCVRILQQSPDDVETLLMLAKCFFQAGEQDMTRTVLERVLAIEPANALAGENLAVLAQPAVSSAQRLEQHLRSGQKLLAEGNLSGARQELEQAASLAPDDADLQVCVGNLQAEQGDIDAARKSYSQALKAEPKHTAASQRLIELTIQGESKPAVSASNVPRASQPLGTNQVLDPSENGAVPSPSPSGRGSGKSNVPVDLEPSPSARGGPRFSLSRGERAGVRGKEPSDSLKSSTPDLRAQPRQPQPTDNSKEAHELAYWKLRKEQEGTLANAHYRNFFTNHFALTPEFYAGKRVMDIGCGPRGSLEWADMAQERVGLDPLADKYRDLGTTEHKMRYEASGSETIPFPNGHFDVVTSFNSLDHVADLSRTIQEIKRVVKPGGLFLLLTDVNHAPTPCEPIEFSWDVVKEFQSAFEVVEERHFEKLPKEGLYRSVQQGVAYDHHKPGRRSGILSVKFRRLPVAVPTEPGAPASPCQDAAFRHLQRAFDLLKERKFTAAQAECGLYREEVNYDGLDRTDRRTEAAPEVSVVIVAYKIGQGLIQCLDSLAASTTPHEIIVVDNGGNEDIAAELARRPLLHVQMPINVILSEGRNVGVHFARAPIVSFVDDDAVAASGYLASVAEAFEMLEVCAFRGKVLPKTDHPNNSKARHYNLGDLAIPADVDTEGNSAFLTEVYRELGGMDPLLFGMEGTDLSYRIAKRRGDFVNIYWPKAVIHHDYASTDDKLGTKQARHQLMRDYAISKHPDLYERHNRIVAFAQSDPARRAGNKLIRRRRVTTATLAQAPPATAASPFISICIPTYNRADLLAVAVTSALQQTYGHYEVVVVDDGSTDETAAVMRQLAHERVRYVRKEHSGGPASRNRCVAESRGEFIVWLDSDDAILPRTLDHYASELACFPEVDVLYGDLRAANADLTGGIIWVYRDYFGWPDLLVRDLAIENRVPNVCALVRKSCYAAVGGYDEAFPRAHDYEFWTRLAGRGVFRRIPEVVAIYRMHGKSLSQHNGPTDTRYEANAVKGLVQRHGLRRVMSHCFGTGTADAAGEANANLILAGLMVKYGDLPAARDYARQSVEAAQTARNSRFQHLLELALGGAPRETRTETSETARLGIQAARAYHAGQKGDCARACARLTELQPGEPETLLLVSLSLLKWGDARAGKAAFHCLVQRLSEAAHKDVVEAERILSRPGESQSNDVTGGAPTCSLPESAVAELASVLGCVFDLAGPVPANALRETIALVDELAAAADPRRATAQRPRGLTPLLIGLLGLERTELARLAGAAFADKVQRVRAAVPSATLSHEAAPSSKSTKRPAGYSFCIITNGKRPEKLRRQIESIRALRIPSCEILVGGETNCDLPGVQYVPMPDAARNGRLGEMRNALAARARFDHLVVSDDDMIFDPGFHDGLRRFGENYDVMAVRIRNPDGSRFWDWATTGGPRGQVLLDYWETDLDAYVTGGLCVLKTAVLDKIVWDPTKGFYQAEDVDFSRRLQAAGVTIWLNPFCVVTHDDDRYTRIGRGIMRWEHILGAAAGHYDRGETAAARDFLTVAARLAKPHPHRVEELSKLAARFSDGPWLKEQLEQASCVETAGSVPGVPSDSVAPAATVHVSWQGSFLDLGSLSHVNRELTAALRAQPGLELTCVGRNVIPPELAKMSMLRDMAARLHAQPAKPPQVTVRHAWPPSWEAPKSGAWVLIQPWEFGALPADWVKNLARVDEVWAPSEFVRRCYIDSGVEARKVHVVPNGIDPERFRPDAKPLTLATRQKFKFLFVGGTIRRKGPDVLLRAYLETFSAADDVCLVIKDFGGRSCYAGQTLDAQIKAAQARPGAPEILHLTDDLSADDMAGLYTACDCLVHPYRGEGFGLPVLEAMACGLPVIVTGGGATDDFATDELAYRLPAVRRNLGRTVGDMKLAGEGWWLEPDAAALQTKMRHVLENLDEARARGAAASVVARRDWTWSRAASVVAERLRTFAGTPSTGSKKSLPVPQPASPRDAAPKPMALPACARLGHLAESRDLFGKGRLVEAWRSALAALGVRPYHPEAWSLLGEIAEAAGDAARAKECAARARQLAPGWKPARASARSKSKKIPHVTLPPWPVQFDPARRHTPRLTVCLITKNEERFVGQCLESIRDLAHQIVVIDTGSTDWTRDIAARFGAEISSYTWADDFSAARNAALERATGDWILMLDADEELPAAEREKLRRLLEDPRAIAWRLPMIHRGHEDEGTSFVPRLFRNAPGLFYVGRVHEQIFSSVEVRRVEWGLENKFGDATLLHHGYTAEMHASRDKSQRNLRLLRLAVEEMPGEPNLHMNLGLELMRGKQSEEGLHEYARAFELMSAQSKEFLVPELRETLLTQFTSHLLGAKRHAEVIAVLGSPLARAAGLTASMQFLRGLAQMELKQFSEAAAAFRQCLAQREQPVLSPMHREVRKAGPAHCLALCLIALKEPEAADRAFQDALRDDPHSRAARFDYARFLGDRDRTLEALKCLTQLVEESPGEARFWQYGGQLALQRMEFREFAADWTGEALKHAPDKLEIIEQRVEALLFNGRAEEALPLCNRLAGAGQSSGLAWRALTEVLAGGRATPLAVVQQPRVSQQVIQHYRRWIAADAAALVHQLNGRLDELIPAAPAAVEALKTALAAAA